MLISKFDLYKSEWLELVFDDRNKNYGAYELRRHYGRTMVKAMAITFATIGSAALIVGFLIKPVVNNVSEFVMHPTRLITITHPLVIPPKPLTPHVKLPSVKLPAAAPVAMQKFIPLVVTPDSKVTEQPPKISALTSNIGPANVTGPTTSTTIIDKTPGTTPSESGTSSVVTEFKDLEVMPEPFGGATTWSKFLRKNLHYPEMAIDQHIQGKVWVSFIIEKDGTLSNFKVIRGVGYGLDEEALRVLKLAPAWKPGIQNGQPVRVQYDIPINFQLTDEE